MTCINMSAGTLFTLIAYVNTILEIKVVLQRERGVFSLVNTSHTHTHKMSLSPTTTHRIFFLNFQ